MQCKSDVLNSGESSNKYWTKPDSGADHSHSNDFDAYANNFSPASSKNKVQFKGKFQKYAPIFSEFIAQIGKALGADPKSK